VSSETPSKASTRPRETTSLGGLTASSTFRTHNMNQKLSKVPIMTTSFSDLPTTRVESKTLFHQPAASSRTSKGMAEMRRHNLLVDLISFLNSLIKAAWIYWSSWNAKVTFKEKDICAIRELTSTSSCLQHRSRTFWWLIETWRLVNIHQRRRLQSLPGETNKMA